MTKTHAQILADIAAKVVAQHRDPLDALREATTRALVQPGAKWTPETGWTDEPIDLQARIAAAAAADHTPDWDYKLPQEYQK